MDSVSLLNSLMILDYYIQLNNEGVGKELIAAGDSR